ncbi:hypothetical protein BDQ17DRAFT_1322785 [Cyathus striatus]|nr:hypothetical protein BDQ17DRAFT_1322785 [Cyathus striatus]
MATIALFVLVLGLGHLFLPVLGTSIPRAGCDISKAKIPGLPSTLPTPNATATFVAVAFGTQNYTCGSTGTYSNIGAVAELFDISCLYDTPAFPVVQDALYGIWKIEPSSGSSSISIIKKLNFAKTPAILGEHYFIQNPVTKQGISPKWDFTSEGAYVGNANAFIVAAKVGDIPAPTGSQDVDWLALKNVVGSLADEVYRTDTRSGQPPNSCTPGSPDIVVKYTSKYWFFGGSMKH